LDSSLNSIYDIGKSVIVAGQADTDESRPRRLSESETDSFMPTIPTSSSVITCTHPVLSPADLEDATADHLGLAEDQTSANSSSSSVFLRPISIDDVMVDTPAPGNIN